MVSFLFGCALIAAFLPNVLSACGTCGAKSHVACIGERKFNYCYDADVPDETTVAECNVGSVCTDTPAICVPNGTPDCVSECGKCGTDGKFACMSQTTFALCLGTQKPTDITGTCPAGKQCKMNTPNFCIDPPVAPERSSCAAQEEVTTQKPTTTTTTTRPPTSAADFCKRPGVIAPRRYPVEGDPTCQKYIYCYILEGLVVGQQYTCPGSTIFNLSVQKCVARRGGSCPTF